MGLIRRGTTWHYSRRYLIVGEMLCQGCQNAGVRPGSGEVGANHAELWWKSLILLWSLFREEMHYCRLCSFSDFSSVLFFFSFFLHLLTLTIRMMKVIALRCLRVYRWLLKLAADTVDFTLPRPNFRKLKCFTSITGFWYSTFKRLRISALKVNHNEL